MWSKVKPNVLVLSAMAAGLVLFIVWQLFTHVDDLSGFPFGEIVSMIIGIGIGSLLTIASQVAQDPPPPTVPASTVEKILDKVK